MSNRKRQFVNSRLNQSLPGKLYQFQNPASNINNPRSTDSTPSRAGSRSRKSEFSRTRSHCSLDRSDNSTSSNDIPGRVRYYGTKRFRHYSSSEKSDRSVNQSRHRNCSRQGYHRQDHSPGLDHNFFQEYMDLDYLDDRGRHSSCSDISSIGRNSSLPPTNGRREKGKRRTISVPPGLKDILNQLSKEVLHCKPDDIPGFCADILERKLVERTFDETGSTNYYLDQSWCEERGAWSLPYEGRFSKTPDGRSSSVAFGGRSPSVDRRSPRHADGRVSRTRKIGQETQTETHPEDGPSIQRTKDMESQTGTGTDSDSGFETSLNTVDRRGNKLNPKQIKSRTCEVSTETNWTELDADPARPTSAEQTRIAADPVRPTAEESLAVTSGASENHDSHKQQNPTSADLPDFKYLLEDGTSITSAEKSSSDQPLELAILQLAQTIKDYDTGQIESHQHQPLVRPSPVTSTGLGTSVSSVGAQEGTTHNSGQILSIEISVNGTDTKQVSFLVTGLGVTKIPNESVEAEHCKLRKTTVPIQIENQKSAEGTKSEIIADTSDLGTSCFPSPSSNEEASLKRLKSVSPIRVQYNGKRSPLIRQNTFVESGCQTKPENPRKESSDCGVQSDNCSSLEVQHTQTDAVEQREIKTQTNFTITRNYGVQCGVKEEARDQETQCDPCVETTQCLTVTAMPDEAKGCITPEMLQTSHALIQTEQSPVKVELITEEFPLLSRTPCAELRFNSTQTEPLKTCVGEVQTACNSNRSSAKSAKNIDRNNTFIKDNSMTDEIVCRVLLEHVAEEEETSTTASTTSNQDKENAKKSPESDPGIGESARSPSISLDELNRAASENNYREWSDLVKLPLDISRSVNYMDLSKLGNEGETPNSEEMWVNVEDDNKFLTSDTETYSVATDKVSTMATCRGYAVGANGDMSNYMRSVSEAELLEFGSDTNLDGQISAKHLADIMRSEMEPVKECLGNTEQTISSIAGTLLNIQEGVNNLCCNVTQMKSKVLSNGENEASLFEDDEKLELVKNGRPNGNPNELVDMIMIKLEKLMFLRDEQLEGVIKSLQDDNSYLRKELETYRQNIESEGKSNLNLENKVQEMIENMKNIKGKSPSSCTTSSPSSLETKQSSDNKRKPKKRSRSKHNETLMKRNGSNLKLNGNKNKEYVCTSTDEEVEQRNIKNNLLSIPKLTKMVDSEQQTTDINLNSIEIQTCDLITAEASTLTDMIIKESTNIELSDGKDPAVVETSQGEKVKVKTKTPPKNNNDKGSKKKTDLKDKKVNESVKKSVSKSNSKGNEPTEKVLTLTEVTESMTFIGQGLGADGGAPSPTPVISTVQTTAQIKVESETGEKPKLKNNESKSGKVKKKDVKDSVPSKGNGKPGTKSESSKNGKSNNNQKANPTKKKDQIDKEKSQPSKSGTGKHLLSESAAMSKIIEGDDFKITITSNQELVSCELSDIEENSSPRKKIIVTPKTPDKKDPIKEQKEEVAKKNRKIPISKQYIKPKNEIPAPEQYPVARPPTNQIPAPSASYSSMSPMCFDIPGYNHNQPPTPTQDYSICSNTYPISGRNTQMSMEGEVITMMIKQESRDSNVYDAPSSIPDYFDLRESPDGAYSYVIDGPIRSSMSNISDLKYDNEEESSDGVERDVIMEFVMMEESMERGQFKHKGPSPFKGYAERVKHKVIREFVHREKLPENRIPVRPKLKGGEVPTKPQIVRQSQRRKLWRSRAQSVSNEKLSHLNNPVAAAKKLIQSKRNCFSTDRLPMLTPSEEERIIRIKKYEDDTEKLNESKRLHNMRKISRNFVKQPTIQNGDVVIYENSKSQPTYDTEKEPDKTKEMDSGVESKESSSDGIVVDSDSGRDSKNKKLEPIDKANRRILTPDFPPLSVECFIVSRGWHVDQAQLTKALAKLEGINFVRIQVANTMNRVLENIRPNNDVVLIHIGTQEIGEACHSITNEESIAGVAGSIATVYSKHIITASRTFRETNFVLSLPIPRNTSMITPGDCLTFHDRLRKAFNSCLKANVNEFENIVLCNNDNLGGEGGQPDSRFYTDSVHLSSAGLRKLSRNWDAVIKKMIRTPDGHVLCRRSSESSSMTSSSSAGSSTSKSSVVRKEPWKPY